MGIVYMETVLERIYFLRRFNGKISLKMTYFLKGETLPNMELDLLRSLKSASQSEIESLLSVSI